VVGYGKYSSKGAHMVHPTALEALSIFANIQFSAGKRGKITKNESKTKLTSHIQMLD
jgi:hypothetical protein